MLSASSFAPRRSPVRQCSSVVLLAAFLSISVFASEDPNIDPEMVEMNAAKKVRLRGSELLPHNIPGETFHDMTGQIGHSAVDMTLSDNGPLSFSVRRTFKEQPAIYPYAFSNHSLSVPYIEFETNLGVVGDEREPNDPHNRFESASLMNCNALMGTSIPSVNWVQNPDVAVTELLDGITFNYSGGVVNLIPRALLTQSALVDFPSDALLISADNWLLKCNTNGDYVVHQPDGTEYRFQAGINAEKWFSRRKGQVIKNGNLKTVTYYYSRYRLHVTQQTRLQSTLTYDYEFHPTLKISTDGANNPATRIDWVPGITKPLTQSSYFDNVSKAIEKKRRLTKVTLRTDGDSNTENASTQFVTFNYRGATDLHCPGVLESVESTTTVTSKVIYAYSTIRPLNTAKVDYEPPSRCVLTGVSTRQGAGSGLFEERWAFDYGYQEVGVSAPLNPFFSGATGNYSPMHFYYLPLKRVTIPTGAYVDYRYTKLTPCNWNQIDYSQISTGPDDGQANCHDLGFKAGRPALDQRTVVPRADDGANSLSQVSTMHYLDDFNANRAIRELHFGGRVHKLTYRRTERLSKNSLPDNGKLLSHELKDSSGTVLYRNQYVWHEYDVFSQWHSNRQYSTWPDDDNLRIVKGGYQWRNARRNYLYDSRRFVLHATVTTMNGYEFTTKNEDYDRFGFPRKLTEEMVPLLGTSGSPIARLTTLGYAHKMGPGGRNTPWVIGLLATRSVASGESKPYVESFGFNAKGQKTIQNIGGVEARFAYRVHGQLKWVRNASGVLTWFRKYRHGIAREQRDPLETTWQYRQVDAQGRLTQEKQTISSGTTTQVDYQYNGSAGRLSLINPAGSVGTTTFTPAQWRSSSLGAYRRSVSQSDAGLRVTTDYDSFGRVVEVIEEDVNSVFKSVRVWRYDHLGRLSYAGDPSSTATQSLNSGMVYLYDFADRLRSAKHTSASAGKQYCYGPGCGSGTLHGVKVTDEIGNWTVSNFRALGDPSALELVSVKQRIGSGKAVTTQLTRNLIGFVKKVRQLGSGAGAVDLTREYFPLTWGSTTTHRLDQEIHPEFGMREAITFDAMGNVTKRREFDGSKINIDYDTAGRVTAQRFNEVDTSTGIVRPADINYTYTYSGLLKTASQGSVVWTMGYEPGALLKSETLSIDGQSFGIVYGYDNAGAVETITYPSGRVISYENDALGRPTSIDQVVSGGSYHPNGLIAGYNLANGTAFSTTQDARLRPNTWNVSAATGQSILDYDYDSRGNIKSIDNYFPATGGDLHSLSYDGLSRLTGVTGHFLGTGDATASFSYDEVGNVTSRSLTATGASAAAESLSYGYDATSNQLQSVNFMGNAASNYVMSYDALGNVTGTGAADYTFDHMNRMVESDLADATQTMTYDVHGMRSKLVTNHLSANRTDTRYFVYSSNGQLLYEKDATTGEERDHVYLGGTSIATIYRHNNADTDDDGMSDLYESLQGLDKLSATDANADDDGDRISNLVEAQRGLLASSIDSDGNGLIDSHPNEIQGPAATSSSEDFPTILFTITP